jgi:uncharacterized protein (TIGR03382 family)
LTKTRRSTPTVVARAALAALALLAASAAPSVASGAEVWAASATEKIRPSEKARAVTEARISAARNEFESFQVVVTGPASKVSASIDALSGPGRIDGITLYRADLMNVQTPSALDGATGSWPDALVPDVDDVVGEKRNAFPFDVRSGESRAIWVEVFVPADARPGVYTGEVTVRSAEGEARLPVTLEVWDFELPSTSSLRTDFGLGYGLVAAAHGVAAGEADASLRARYAQLGLDHRISMSRVSDDGFHRDYAHFDRHYRSLVDGTAPTRLEGAQLTSVRYVGDATSVAEHRAWADRAKAQGWFDRLFDYTCDEPPLTCSWSDINVRTRAVHEADPGFRTLVTTTVWDAQDHGVLGGIDILVPVVNWMDDRPGSPVAGDQRPRYDGFLSTASRKELWMYQSCMSHGCGGTVNIGNPSETDRANTGWPSYMIDASSVRNRAMEWISYLYDVTGELYWETAATYRKSPWTSQYDFSGNGDGTLFYPGTPARIGGTTHIPVASIRLKMIREGMEDYEYLRLLEAAGGGAQAKEIARGLFPKPYEAEQSPEALMAAREELAVRILAASGKSPVGVGSTPGAPGAPGAPGGKTSQLSGAGGGGGCGSSGGSGAGAVLAVPLLAALIRRRRRAEG